MGAIRAGRHDRAGRLLVLVGLALPAAFAGCGSSSKDEPGGAANKAGGGKSASAGNSASAGRSGRTGSGGRAGAAAMGSGGVAGSSTSAGSAGVAGRVGDRGGSDTGGDVGNPGGAGGEGGGVAPHVAFVVCGNMGIAGINDARYLPDGSAVVLAVPGGVAKLVDPTTGAEIRTFIGHAGAANAVAVAGDSATLATASDDHTVRLFRVADATPLAVLTAGDSPILRVAITADASRIVAGAADGTIYLWTRDSSSPTTIEPVKSVHVHTDQVLGIGFAAAEGRVFSASKDGSVRIWSADDLGSLGAPLMQSGNWITALGVSPDGARVAVGDVSGTVTFFAASAGTVERSVAVGLSRIWNLDFAPDGAEVFGGIEDVYSIPVNGSMPTLVAGPIGSPPYAAASPLIDAVFVASQWIMEYDTRSGTPLRDEVHEGPFAYATAFDPAGDHVAIGGDFGLVIRGAPNGAVLATPDFRQSSPIYEGLDFSPDGSHFVTGTGDGLIHLWTTADWQSQMEIDTVTRGVHSAFFSPNGSQFVAAGYDGVNNVYDAASGTLLQILSFRDRDNHKAVFSSDGALTAVGSDGGDLAVVRVNDWTELLNVQNAHEGALDLAFAPDGRLFTTGDQRVSVWQTSGSTERHDVLDDATFDGEALEVSPDGEVLVAGTVAGEIRVWALPKPPAPVPSTAGAGPEAGAPNAGSSAGGESGAPAPLPDPVVVPSLPGHASPVRHMRFSRDAQRLAAAYADGSTWVWCRQ